MAAARQRQQGLPAAKQDIFRMQERAEHTPAEQRIGSNGEEAQAGGAERQLSPELLETLCLTEDTVRSPAS